MRLLRSAEMTCSNEFGISVNRITSDARLLENSLPVGIMKCVVAPGGNSVLHRHEEREMFFVAEGNGAINTGEVELMVTEGDVAILDAHEAHSVRNISVLDPLIFLSIYWVEENIPPDHVAS
jgi:mannose-6-phosphate isomerase-like protein (cupin superfamily)